MDNDSATHRPSNRPRTDGTAEARAADGARNNLAPVNPEEIRVNVARDTTKDHLRELLFFGKDFLVLNLGILGFPISPSIRFLNDIFSISHNDTNASEIPCFIWADTDQEVAIHYAFTKDGDELAQIFHDGEKIISIQRIGKNSVLHQVKYKYLYRITFYGTFFALHRIGKLDIETYWNIFLCDLEQGKVPFSISRLDLCADITNISPMQIAKGIRGEESHKKKFSTLKGTLKNPDPETVMYGSKGDNRWFARLYNKLNEIAYRGKERFYLDYLLHPRVTRLEIVLKSPVLQEYKLTLAQCLDDQHLFNIFCDHLHTKYVSWKILPFIKREMKKKGFQRIKLERYKKLHNPLHQDEKFKRILNASSRYCEDYAYDHRAFCEWLHFSLETDDD